MKRPVIFLLILVCLAVGFVAGVRAGSSTLLASLVTLNGTTNTLSFSNGVVSLPRITYQIQNGGLTATTALSGNAQFSLDNVNFTTYATYSPTVTNATVDTFVPSTAALPLYFRLQLVTTNAVGVGVIATY